MQLNSHKNLFSTYYKVIVWSIIIGVLVFTPGSEFRQVKINIPHFDKIIHFGLFLILGWFIAATPGYQNGTTKRYLLPGLAIVYALLIELIQHYFIFMRSGDVVDFISDIVGLLVGIISIKWWPEKFRWIIQ